MVNVLKINPIWEPLKDGLQMGCNVPTMVLDENTNIKYLEGALNIDTSKSAF